MTELIKPLPSYLDKESRKPEATDVVRDGNRAAQAAIISESQRRGDDIEYYITANAREFSNIDEKYVVSFWKALLKSDTLGCFLVSLGLAVAVIVIVGIMMCVARALDIPSDEKASWAMVFVLGVITLAGVIVGLINLLFDYKHLAHVKEHGFTEYYLDNLRASARTLIGVGGKGLYFIANPWTGEQLKVNLCHYDALDKVRAGNNLVLISRDGGPAYIQNSWETWGEGYHNGSLESDLNSRIDEARKK